MTDLIINIYLKEGSINLTMSKILPNTFNLNTGNHIRSQREKLGYSREQLAELAGMSDGYLGEVERGTKGLSSYLLYHISISLGTSMDFLVSLDRDTSNPTENELQTILNLLHICKEADLVLIEKIIRAIVFTD